MTSRADGCCQATLSATHTRDAFVAQAGAPSLVALVSSEQAAIAAASAGAAAAAARQHESAKVALFGAGAMPALLKCIKRHESSAPAVAAAASALFRLATPDDPRVAASCAFAHGRALATAGGITALLLALRAHPEDAARGPLLCALRCAAVNDDACALAADGGAVIVGVAALRSGGPLVLPALALLRQLAGCDVVKPLLLSAGGLPPLLDTLRCAAETPKAAGSARTAEAGLALLSALSLRTADCVAAIAAGGAIDVAATAMEAFPACGPVQRAACMFFRNVAARNQELRGPMSDRGLEALLRAAKHAHPSLCVDVGSAALRDLGCDAYNEGWNPTTVYMGDSGQLLTYDELDGADGNGRQEEEGGRCASLSVVSE